MTKEIDQILQQKKELHHSLLQFFEYTRDSSEERNILIDIFKNHDLQNKDELRFILNMILNITNNCHRCNNFYQKIDSLFVYLKKDIKSTFTNFEIYDIFQNSKLILLVLFTEKIIKVDQTITDDILSNHHKFKYQFYFYPEIKQFLSKEQAMSIEEELPTNDFNEKRKIGENDSLLCTLIRNDSIKEFIQLIIKTNLPVSSIIEPSIFETNDLFLFYSEYVTLIEYATFYGSMKIINYLINNGVKLQLNLWIYAAHSINPKLIHFIEDNLVLTENDEYTLNPFLSESISCHNNNIANYIINLLFPCSDEEIEKYTFSYSLKYYNFSYLPAKYQIKDLFFKACKYNHFDIVKFLLNGNYNINLNEKIVLKSFFFLLKS